MSSSSKGVVVDYNPKVVHVDFPRGDTFLPDQIKVIDAITKLPIDMTTYSAAMRVRKHDGTVIVDLSSAPGGGIVLGNGFIEISANTSAWPEGCSLYSDLQLTTPGGKVETWLKFVIKLTPTITPP